MGMAAGVAAISWLIWSASSNALAIGLADAVLVIVYFFGSYRVIRMGSFRRAVVAEFMVLSVVALCAMWLLGAVVAALTWSGPIGPSN
jgi:hypothetical protein